MVAELPIWTRQDCAKKFIEARLDKPLTENMICAGAKGLDACAGDGASPLTCKRNGKFASEGEEPYVCGIVSWGVNCRWNRKGLPGVYTDVSKYRGWIEKFKRSWEKLFWGKKEHFHGQLRTFRLLILSHSQFYVYSFQLSVETWAKGSVTMRILSMTASCHVSFQKSFKGLDSTLGIRYVYILAVFVTLNYLCSCSNYCSDK